MWLPFIAAAAAHPFESRLYGHQTTLWLDGGQIVVEYAVEIPTARLLEEIRASISGPPTEADQQAFNERLHRDLKDALRLMVDEKSVSWAAVEPTEDSGRGDVKFIVYRVQLGAVLPEGARTLQLIDGNFPDEPSIFQTSVLVDDSILVDASSQLSVEHGVLTSNLEGQWRPEEDSRELRLSFRHRSPMQRKFRGSLHRLGNVEGVMRPASEVLSSLESGSLAGITNGRLQPVGVGMVLLLSLVSGGAVIWRRWLVGLSILGAAGLAVVGLTTLSGVSLALSILVAAVGAMVGRMARNRC